MKMLERKRIESNCARMVQGSPRRLLRRRWANDLVIDSAACAYCMFLLSRLWHRSKRFGD
jgi:hypothetical protein